jgi:hypothetical protein
MCIPSSSSILQAKNNIGCYHILPVFLYPPLCTYVSLLFCIMYTVTLSTYLSILFLSPPLCTYLSLLFCILYFAHISAYISVSFALYIFIPALCTYLFLLFCILHIFIPTVLYPGVYGETGGKKGRCVLSVSTPLIRTREMSAMFICSTYEHSLPPSGFYSLPHVFHTLS